MVFQEDVTPNDVFLLAEKFISETSRCIFLTGKAGTGKTTFLRHIKEATTKNTVVVAPTGVSAIHAGGTTLHSFFQLPFTPFVPVDERGGYNLGDRYKLLKESKIDGEKKVLLRELELLIIDEISMVRCDVLDAVDIVLRHFRGKEHLPFGGVQVLFIGDLFQLPPVMPDQDWRVLQPFYKSSFFFDAYVIKEARPVCLELRKIYRQQDPFFIEVLNRVRNNDVAREHLMVLNERYQPDFKPAPEEKFVTLTTHNYKADAINTRELNALSGPEVSYEGVVEGDFSERSFPTDRILNLKVGAQVMFIKNDMERIRRYYNGRIGTVTRLENDKIWVQCEFDEPEIEVIRDMWRNVRYSWNPSARQVEEEELGTFTQYALRLAWAVTIHKSQGLTLENVIIDAGQSFAPGQVYVALSRCTTLSGIVLHSRILPSSIQTDPRVVEFASRHQPPESLQPLLQQARLDHIVLGLLTIFDLDILRLEILDLRKKTHKRKSVEKQPFDDRMDLLLERLFRQQQVAMRFRQQLQELMNDARYDQIPSRVEAAVTYFNEFLDNEMNTSL